MFGNRHLMGKGRGIGENKHRNKWIYYLFIMKLAASNETIDECRVVLADVWFDDLKIFIGFSDGKLECTKWLLRNDHSTRSFDYWYWWCLVVYKYRIHEFARRMIIGFKFRGGIIREVVYAILFAKKHHHALHQAEFASTANFSLIQTLDRFNPFRWQPSRISIFKRSRFK